MFFASVMSAVRCWGSLLDFVWVLKIIEWKTKYDIAMG